jgi:hypothetical protein
MISNLKVSDGDMLFVHLQGDDITQAHIQAVREKLDKWAKKRGLRDVEFIISGGAHKMEIAKFTVNDIFENEVLKGDSNG